MSAFSLFCSASAGGAALGQRLVRASGVVSTLRYSAFRGRHQLLYSTASAAAPDKAVSSDSPAPRTFDFQSQLPRLPIPTLNETSERYLRSLQPLLTPEEYKRSEAAVAEFIKPNGFGEELQARLQAVDKEAKYSWLEDLWLKKGYLEWREPTLINVNWWAQFRDPSTGVIHPSPSNGTYSMMQLRRAAGFVSSMLDINDQINNQTYPVDKVRDKPLCMNQVRCQFGASRIAEHPADRLQLSYPALARHIIVLAQDQIFKVQVITEEGRRVPVKLIERQLRDVIDEIKTNNVDEPSVGLLTAAHRDAWATARNTLMSLSPQNKHSLETIDSALFAICLDRDPASSNHDKSHHALFHANDAHNRWFDKAIQLIVANNGRAGINGEHTPADAVIPGAFFNKMILSEPVKDPVDVDASAVLPAPELLKWTVDTSVREAITEAHISARKLINGIESNILHYQNYGAEFFKNAHMSPDAAVQMALQLAYYRLHGKPCPTYETASTRAFLHGRTETVRSCSVESVAFTRAFDDRDVPREKKLQLLQQALSTHVRYMWAASSGKGVDRHLLGLRCQIRNTEEQKLATLFTDPAYVESMSFRLSTSNMSPGETFWGGFGAVVKDGYGINYGIGQNHIKFSVSAWRECEETSAAKMREQIKRSLNDFRKLLE